MQVKNATKISVYGYHFACISIKNPKRKAEFFFTKKTKAKADLM